MSAVVQAVEILQAREPGARYLGAVQPALVGQFELLATAPEGVARLRELILTLAVQGRLVPQDRSDEPANVFVEPISSRRAEPSGGRERNQTPGLVSTEEDVPFDLPIGWQRARLGSVFTLQYGAALPEKTRIAGSIPVYGSNGQVGTHCKALVQHPSLVIGRKGSVGAVNITSGPFWPIDTSYFVTPPNGVHLQFAYWLFRSLRLGKHDKATAIPGISRNDVYAELIALPPTAEQARIVARVDELMRLCDALEAQGRLESEQHARLLGTLLGTLTDSSTPEELAANWQRVAAHFDLLLDRPEAVDALEQTILQLAERGLLVPQDPSDEPASALVSRINAGRVSRRTAAATPNLADIDRPDLPIGWCVTNFGSVAECLDYLRRPVKKSDREASAGSIPYFGANGQVGWINEHLFDEDLVLVVEDETFIGRTKPFSYVVRGKSWVNNHAHVLRPLGGLSAEFLNLCLQRYDFIPLTSGTTNRRKLTQAGLLNAEFMIAPCDEQARILARVTELRRLCADLRQRLTASQTTQSHLAEALVEQAAA